MLNFNIKHEINQKIIFLQYFSSNRCLVPLRYVVACLGESEPQREPIVYVFIG